MRGFTGTKPRRGGSLASRHQDSIAMEEEMIDAPVGLLGELLKESSQCTGERGRTLSPLFATSTVPASALFVSAKEWERKSVVH